MREYPKYWELSPNDGTYGDTRISIEILVDDSELEMFKKSDLGYIKAWEPLNACYTFVGKKVGDYGDDLPVIDNLYPTCVVSNRLKDFLEKEVPGYCQFLEIQVEDSIEIDRKGESYWILHPLEEIDIIYLPESEIEENGVVWIPIPVIDPVACKECSSPIGRLKRMGWMIIVNDSLRASMEDHGFVGTTFLGFRYIVSRIL